MNDIENYMKKELVDYITQEMNKGYSLSAIKDALLRAGHNKDIIDVVLDSLKKHKFNILKAMQEPMPDHLTKDLYYDVLNALVKYIEYHIEQGQSIEKIKKALTNYGHTEETIIDAIERVMQKKQERPAAHSSIIITLSWISLVLLIIILSILNSSSLATIVVGLVPAIITLILLSYLVNRTKRTAYLWVFPIALPIAFYLLTSNSQSAMFNVMNVGVLTFVNLAVSLFYSFLILLSKPKS